MCSWLDEESPRPQRHRGPEQAWRRALSPSSACRSGGGGAERDSRRVTGNERAKSAEVSTVGPGNVGVLVASASVTGGAEAASAWGQGTAHAGGSFPARAAKV